MEIPHKVILITSLSSFDDKYIDESYREQAIVLDSNIADWYDWNRGNDNHQYTQPGLLSSTAMNDYYRQNLVANIEGAMSVITGPKRELIIHRQLCHFLERITSQVQLLLRD